MIVSGVIAASWAAEMLAVIGQGATSASPSGRVKANRPPSRVMM
jgi:hypothetical protein